MGWRPEELLSLKREDVNLDTWSIKGGMKTSSGRNRIVPIHTAIRDIIKEAYDSGGEYLFTINGKKISYTKYLRCFDAAIKELGLARHKPHDGRKHFITMAKRYGVDEYAIKRIVGHSITDITENVYTDRDLNWLHKEISKIP